MLPSLNLSTFLQYIWMSQDLLRQMSIKKIRQYTQTKYPNILPFFQATPPNYPALEDPTSILEDKDTTTPNLSWHLRRFQWECISGRDLHLWVSNMYLEFPEISIVRITSRLPARDGTDSLSSNFAG